MKTPIFNYQERKHLIQNADILLFKSGRFPNFGWWISRYTNSSYSHAALAYWEDDELYCLEFREFEGSRQYPIVEYLKQGCQIDVFRPFSYIEYPIAHETPDGIIVENHTLNFDIIVRQNIINTAKELMHKPYSWWTIWQVSKNYIPLLRLRKTRSKNGNVDVKQFVCSTLVAYSYRINYIDPVPFLPDEHTTPGDLSRSAAFFKLFEIIFDKS
jgi:hypothetical protein